jgi:hypothetical protein
MGDRVYMRITCRREDAPHFEKLGFVEDEAESEIAVSMVDDEANYGHSQPLRELARGGVPFLGWHDAGGEYDSRVLASDGVEYAEALCTAQEPRPLAPVNADGSIDADGLREALRYHEVLVRAQLALGVQEEAAPGKTKTEREAREGP